jgi:CubicO group peptidase (beta-lactamase class C family)
MRPILIANAALLCAALAGAATVTPLAAQQPTRPAEHVRVAEALRVMDVWLEAQRAYEQIPGVSAALVHDQEVLWQGGYGYAHPDRRVPATAETIYSICSISKLFTGIALMQLRDRGLVALSDPVDRHLPWFTLRQAHPGTPVATVHGLLTHAAGLPRESDHPYWSAPDFAFPTREQIVEGVRNQETLYPAWRYFQYSNLGLALVGEIVAERSGVPYARYVEEQILAPLGMRDTRPFMPAELQDGSLATGFSALTRDGERRPVPFFDARGIDPAAGFSSTAADLARFAAWHFRMQRDRSEVLHAHTLQEMTRVHYVDPAWNTFWGLAYSISRSDNTTFVGHGGSCPGYRSQLLMQLDDRVAAVFMANASGVDTGKYVRGMYALLAPALKEATRAGDQGPTAAASRTGEANDVAASSPAVARVDLERYLGTFDSMPWGGEIAVVKWRDGLALLSLPTDNPVRAITRLQHVEDHTFRRIREDDQPGETVRFEIDGTGRAVALHRFENRYPRIR